MAAFGPVYGVIFLGCLAMAVAVRPRLGWSGTTTATMVLAAVARWGRLWVERRLPAGSAEPA